jgi:type IV secretion system protein VirD4
MGRVAVFDPTGSTGLAATSSWTPMLRCRDWAGARRVASGLCDAAAPNKRSLTDGDFWYSAAAKLLAPILYAAATAGLTMDEVVAWIDTQEERLVLAALEATGCQAALDAMQANWSRDERQRSSVYTTAETVLEAYADPGVLDHSRVPEIRPDWFLDGGQHTLYICASAREQRRLRPVFVTLLQEMLEGAYAKASHEGGPLAPSLLVVLDEVANIAPLPDLDVLVSTAAGHGVQLLTILQDLAQAYDRWGRERADTIINNHRAKLLGAGLADERALDWIGRLLGDQTVDQRSVTSGETGRRSTTQSSHFRPLAPANVVREARAGDALLVYGNLAPAWIRLRPWYADTHLGRLAGEPSGR